MDELLQRVSSLAGLVGAGDLGRMWFTFQGGWLGRYCNGALVDFWNRPLDLSPSSLIAVHWGELDEETVSAGPPSGEYPVKAQLMDPRTVELEGDISVLKQQLALRDAEIANLTARAVSAEARADELQRATVKVTTTNASSGGENT